MELTRAVSQAKVASFLGKGQHAVALAIFFAMVARIVWNIQAQRGAVESLLADFDRDHNQRVSAVELQRLLEVNGVDLKESQVRALFGKVDEENDGYESEELARVMYVLADLPTASKKIQNLGAGAVSVPLDVALLVLMGLGFVYLLRESHTAHTKLAASKFMYAAKSLRMRNEVDKLQSRAEKLHQEKAQLEQQMQELQEAAGDISPGRVDGELVELQRKLNEVAQQEAEVRRTMEAEVEEWRGQAQKHMEEAERGFKRIERLMSCIGGLDAFNGVAKADSALCETGAQRGFASKTGFKMDTITFGTLDEGKLLMFETSESRKLGEGRDCAYLCTDMASGRDFALKKYRIAKKSHRESAMKDLLALKSHVARHPRVVDYERVIESADQVFVLMELIKGQDLFTVIIETEKGLAEKVAAPLFRDLTEAVQHLHKHDVIHCDIKPENAMVEGDVAAGTAKVKLIDFGCSAFLQHERTEALTMPFDPYTPPEHAYQVSLATPKPKPVVASDMWRMGCTLFIMLLRCPPFHPDGASQQGYRCRMSNSYYRTTAFEGLSTSAKDLVSKLIVGKPEDRIDTQGVLEHPWLAGC